MTGLFIHKAKKRVLLITGLLFIGAASVLFAMADTPNKYWTYVFPGILLGFFGGGLALTGCVTFIMTGAGMNDSGVVAAAMQTAVTVGITVGLTGVFLPTPKLQTQLTDHISFFIVVTAVCLGVGKLKDPTSPFPAPSHVAYQASFFSLLPLSGLTIIMILIFVRD
jgi:MFS family permease